MFTSHSEKSINSLTFYPSSNYRDGLRYLDISFDTAGEPVVQEGALDDDSIQTWIEGSDRKTKPSRHGGIRLLLAGRTGLTNLFDQLPFSKITFLTISRAFALPAVYPAVLASKMPHYIHNSSRNSAGGDTISFISRTFSFSRAGHALASTYNGSTKINSAIIQGPKELGYLSKVCKYIKERPDLAFHPAFLPVVIAQLEYETMDEAYIPLREDMIHIEKWTGHGQLISTVNEVNPNLYQDLPVVTRELNLFSSKVAAQTERVKSCLLRHEEILQIISRVDQVCSETSAQSKELRQHAEFLATGWKSMLHRYEAFEKNVQVQLAVLYNTAVQRDSKLNLDVARSSASIAAASKRDGSVMKSISLLTMVFLPATFVSTLFAMPLFNWSADRVAAIATPFAWIYLAVALPLTVAVVAVWSAWMWYNREVRTQKALADPRETEQELLDAPAI